VTLRRRRHEVPSPDARVFRRERIRTTAIRAVLALLALVLAAAAFVSARGLEPRSNELVPGGRSGVVVLDVSLSIVAEDYGRVRGVLERLIRSNNPMGLVVFSDVSYELLPPRTPAKELRPLLRFFTSTGDGAPPNPWTPAFQAGTRISEALALARDMLRRDRVSPASILLISDLETAPTDLPVLGRVLGDLRRSPITVRVVPLSSSSDGLSFFRGFLGQEAFVDPVEPNAGPPRRLEVSLRGDLPLGLLLASAFALVLLAAHELWAAGLALDARPLWRRA
jgi:von Willebrand factor type A domain